MTFILTSNNKTVVPYQSPPWIRVYGTERSGTPPHRYILLATVYHRTFLLCFWMLSLLYASYCSTTFKISTNSNTTWKLGLQIRHGCVWRDYFPESDTIKLCDKKKLISKKKLKKITAQWLLVQGTPVKCFETDLRGLLSALHGLSTALFVCLFISRHPEQLVPSHDAPPRLWLPMQQYC